MTRPPRIAIALLSVWFGFACLGNVSASESIDVDAALSGAANVDFVDVALDEVLKTLADRHRIPIVADRRSLQSAGVVLDKITISVTLDKTSLGSVLDKILEPHGLAWIMRNDVVLVTTAKAAAEDYYEIRVYRVTGSVPVERRMRSILWNVAPESWATTRGKGDAAPLPPGRLVVYQSSLRHREIARMFARSVVPVRAARSSAPRERSDIEKRLEASAALDIEAASPIDAIKRLGTDNSLKITVDKRALDDAGIRIDDQPITLRAGKVRSLAAGLSLLLESVNPELEWIVENGSIVITTAASAEERMSRATYDVKDILPDGGIDRLIEAIQYTISAPSWEDVGGNGAIKAINENSGLEVLQSDPVHRKLRRLFADLRADFKQYEPPQEKP